MNYVNYFALFGYSSLFIGNGLNLVNNPKESLSLIILLIGLAAFIIYYYKTIYLNQDYTTDKTQLFTNKSAHTFYILFILWTFFILNQFHPIFAIALLGHSLFIYDLYTNTNQLYGSQLFGSQLFGSQLYGSQLFGSQLFGSLLLAIFFGLSVANTTHLIDTTSKIILFGQLLLFVFFTIETYMLS